jgi:hypothetical protein
VGGGEELSTKGEIEGQWRMLELDPVDETTGQNIEDLERLVKRGAQEPLALRLREAQVRNLILGCLRELSNLLKSTFDVQDGQGEI